MHASCPALETTHDMAPAAASAPIAAPLRFLLNGEPVVVQGVPPQTTLLEYLREDVHLTGTKEGCAEGDCGACTVVLAEPMDGHALLSWKPVNACIRLLPSVAGKAVFTVESLRAADGELHPVQRALVNCHGSQCGFCTPGFTMSLFGLFKNALRPSRAAVADALSGNLCRCTGYRPIVDASQAMYDEPPAAVAHDWQGCGVAADGSRVVSPGEARLAGALADLAHEGAPHYEASGQRWWAPRTLDALAALVLAHPAARIVAGATDVGLWVTKDLRDIDAFVHTGNCAELLAIRDMPSQLAIGAAVSLTDAFAALDVQWPELAEGWQRFASVPIRNSGTLGGNVANGSPIGDSMPVLIALGASVVLRRGERTRELPLEALYLAYRKTALEPGEIVVEIRVPRRPPGLLLRAYKASKRYDQDISAAFACFAFTLDGDRVREARIGCGGVAGTPCRAPRTEAAVHGKVWNDATAEAAAAILEDEFTPIDDMRATAGHRKRVLGNLLRRFRLETAGGAPVRTRIDGLVLHEPP